jgi:hypothetical protein
MDSMATSPLRLPDLDPGPRLPARRTRQRSRARPPSPWTLRTRRLYPAGGMVDVAVNELGGVLILVWPEP